MSIDHPAVPRHPTTTSTFVRSRPAIGSSVLPTGIVLVALSWIIAWAGPEPIRWYTFFPLWFGYILTVDGLNYRRRGRSYLTAHPRQFAGMFVASIPIWWIFESLNLRLENWAYHLRIDYPPPIYAILASIAFSTVVPAILETAMLYRSFSASWMHVRSRERHIHRRTLVGATVAGLVMLGLVILFPRQAFPLMWLSVFFVLDPINAIHGRPSLLVQAANGRWSTIISLCCAGLTCGVFWEMWNYWSTPKWTYDVPYVGALEIFEMPLLGYGGYLPFALEIFAFVSLASAWFPSMGRVLCDDRPAKK